jgi:hypothetical protein
MSANPYSPPKAALEVHAQGEYWRDGKNVMCHPGSTLPARCVKCSEPALQPMKARKLYWHHGAWYLLVLLNVVIYVIVALIVRRKATVTYGVCSRHRNRRWLFMAIGWGGSILGLLLLVVNPVIAITVVLAAVLAGFVGARLVYPTRITKEEVRLAGCGEAFLESLELGAKAAPVARAGLGSCPNCAARLPIDAPACLKCKAVLSPGSVLAA